MAITYNDLVGPLIDHIGSWRDFAGYIATLRTTQQGYSSVGSAVATPEFVDLEQVAVAAFDGAVGAAAGVLDAAAGTVPTWREFAARYIRDNETGYDGVTSDPGVLLRALSTVMAADSASVDDSAPSIGSPAYGAQNQGDGTATIAVNGNADLAELLLAGIVRLRCRAAGFTRQNAELWTLELTQADPRSGLDITRISPTSQGARGLKTGTRYFDVAAVSYPGVGLSPLPADQIPQTGANVHTGLNILISSPTYTPTEDSGDVDLVMSAVNVNLVDGAKSNLTRRNTDQTTKGRFYLRIVKDGSDYQFTWYQDSAFTVALTNTITLQTSAGTATQTWKAAGTNPEVLLPGGHLTGTTDGTDGSNFVSATVAAGSLTQSATVIYDANLPWAVGDTITAVATNGYSGVIQRFFVQELGFAIPTAGSPTIADP